MPLWFRFYLVAMGSIVVGAAFPRIPAINIATVSTLSGAFMIAAMLIRGMRR